jgi:hypothetical protein
MHEEELTTIGYEEDYEPMLPDGWSEGDNFFDPTSWSGASDQSGQTEEPESELERIAAEMRTEEEVPTTDETTEEPEGQSPEEETEQPESGQTEEPVKNSRILKLKINHTEQEVDIDSMTDEELIAALQKSKAFDAMKDDQTKAKYREIYQAQLDAGMTEAIAKMVAANECGGKNYPLEDAAEPTEPEAPASRPTAPVRDFVSEVNQLKSLYPDFKEMPDAVARAVADGANLLTAYVAYREQQTSKAAASLKKENEVLKQNAASAAKAPVRGVTGGGATDTKPQNNLLVGFDSDYW